MFEYDIYFWYWEDLDEFEDALIRNGIDYDFAGAYFDQLLVYGDWNDADEAEFLMRLYGIEFYPYI